MIEPLNPDADPRVEFDVDMWCGQCGGYGVVTDAVPLGGTLVLVEWTTQHAPGCPGLACPQRGYVLDLERLDAGDDCLPSPPERPLDELPLAPAPVAAPGCEWCGGSLAGRRPDTLYCGTPCRQAAYRARRGTAGGRP